MIPAECCKNNVMLNVLIKQYESVGLQTFVDGTL